MLKVGDKVIVTNSYPGADVNNGATGKIVSAGYDSDAAADVFTVDISGEYYFFYEGEIEKIG